MKAHTLHLFTSGQLIAWDNKGNQLPEVVIASFRESRNPDIIRKACNEAVVFGIAKHREWTVNLTKEEFKAIMQVD